MSFQTIQQMSGQTMVVQSTRLSLVAETMSYSSVPAASAEAALKPGIPIIKAKPTTVSYAKNRSVPAFSIEVEKVVKSSAPAMPRYQPGHPLADANGQVYYPDVSTITEMTNMMTAARDFDAAVSIFNTAKQMQGQVLDLITV